MKSDLRGVIAATITPVDEAGEPDLGALVQHVRWLLDTGCDGINLLGTTGEATSFGIDQRLRVMRAIAESDLPMSRFMVGTGTSALADTVALTEAAGALGFAGALVLPPFYYKNVADHGMIAYIEALAANTQIPIYLYNFPALSGVTYSPALVAKLIENFGTRIAGLKDSSGNLDYAAEIAALSPDLAVFPSNEASLDRARTGEFAGCISATANLNSRYCAAALHSGDTGVLSRAVRIRQMLSDVPLVPAVKALVGSIHGQPGMARTMPPLVAIERGLSGKLASSYRELAPE